MNSNTIHRFAFFLALIFVSACGTKNNETAIDYPSQFGEISYDPIQDDPAFKLCDPLDLVHSRVSLGYVGGWNRHN